MSLDAVARNGGSWALFLDVDGTLLEIAATPSEVRVPEALKDLLGALTLRLDGALALISGRALDDLDRLFAPLRFCAAGVHGCERRDASGRVASPSIDAQRLDHARETLGNFVNRHPRLILEDKGYALALHFRRVPLLSAEADRVVRTVCRDLGPEFAVQAGKCLLEIRPAACTKGAAIHAFMKQPPFAGRVPIYIGDDLTDEDGFAAVNELGGVSVRVGDGSVTLAQHRLPGVRDVLRWLEGVA